MLQRVFDDQTERAPSSSVFLLDYLPDFAYDFLVEVDQVFEPYLTISLHIDKNVLIARCSSERLMRSIHRLLVRLID